VTPLKRLLTFSRPAGLSLSSRKPQQPPSVRLWFLCCPICHSQRPLAVGNGGVGVLWFAILSVLCAHVITAPHTSIACNSRSHWGFYIPSPPILSPCTDSRQFIVSSLALLPSQRTSQISVFGAVAIVFAVLGVNQGIFTHMGALNAMAAGWLVLAIVDVGHLS
jgi:hypothetical protein